jgi:septal ring factor EnvC (AmiA/AmiB activator)
MTGFVLLSARIENHDRELSQLRAQITSLQHTVASCIEQLPLTAKDGERQQQQLIADALKRSA